MAVEVGAKAPDFTLPNQDRENVTLSDELRKGPVVLAFFPAAFSSVCQNEMCTFRDSTAELGKTGGRVLGVSTDTFFALKAFADQHRRTFPLLSEYNKDVIRKYGVVNPDMIGLKTSSRRRGRERQNGRLRHPECSTIPAPAHFNGVRRPFPPGGSLQNPGNLTSPPTKWKERTPRPL